MVTGLERDLELLLASSAVISSHADKRFGPEEKGVRPDDSVSRCIVAE